MMIRQDAVIMSQSTSSYSSLVPTLSSFLASVSMLESSIITARICLLPGLFAVVSLAMGTFLSVLSGGFLKGASMSRMIASSARYVLCQPVDLVGLGGFSVGQYWRQHWRFPFWLTITPFVMLFFGLFGGICITVLE